jgi:hypothetical protein
VRQEKQEDGKQRRKGEGAEMLKRIPEKKRELIRALVQSGMPYRNVSEEMNVSVGVVNKIMREGEDILPLAAEVRKRLAARYVLLADTALDTITESLLRWQSGKDRAVVAAILTDKALALEEQGLREQDVNSGQPHSNNKINKLGELAQQDVNTKEKRGQDPSPEEQ